jgi:hypothetical protein
MMHNNAISFESLEPRVLFTTPGTADISATFEHYTVALLKTQGYVGSAAVGTQAFFTGFVQNGVANSFGADVIDVSTRQHATLTIPQGGSRAAVNVGPFVLIWSDISNGFDDSVVAYNAVTHAWSNATLSGLPGFDCVKVLGDKAFFHDAPVPGRDGKYIPSNVIHVFDSSMESWSIAHLSEARSGVTAVAVGSKLMFAGGGDSRRESSVVDIYDSATGQWSTAKLSQPRHRIEGSAVGHLALFAGGESFSARHRYSNVVDMYDGDTGKWSVAHLSDGFQFVDNISVGTKVVFANVTNNGTPTQMSVFDSITRTWSPIASPNSLTPDRVDIVGSKVLLSGPLFPNGGDAAPFISVYDVATGQWSTVDAAPGQDSGTVTANDTAIFVRGAGVNEESNLANLYRDTNPAPVLSGGLAGGPGAFDTITVINTGDADLVAPYTVSLYASKDRTLTGAILVGDVAATAPLAARASSQFSVTSVIPKGTPAGVYHLLAAVKDSSGSVTPIAAEDATFSIDRSGRVKPQGSQGHSHAGGGALTRIGRIGGALT